jgi:hypothetical protein
MGRVKPPHILMKIVIVGMGKSRDDYVNEVIVKGMKFDEVWGINQIGNVIRCDKIFMMDDLKWLTERPTHQWVRSCRTPIFTSKKYPEITGSSVEYPLDEVVKKYNTKYFSNTVAYAIAYALFIGVEELILFGCDYDYKGETVHERNRAGTEYWLGIAHATGVRVGISDKSSLMNMDNQKFYGYKGDTQDGTP